LESCSPISSGVTWGPKRATTRPERSIRNLVKFQAMSAFPSSSARSDFRNW